MAANLGLTPREHSSGGKQRLLGITKRGNTYLRTLLIHGARTVLRHATGKTDRLSRWALAIQARRGANVAAVALANKLARIAWAVLARDRIYRRIGRSSRFDPDREAFESRRIRLKTHHRLRR